MTKEIIQYFLLQILILHIWRSIHGDTCLRLLDWIQEHGSYPAEMKPASTVAMTSRQWSHALHAFMPSSCLQTFKLMRLPLHRPIPFSLYLSSYNLTYLSISYRWFISFHLISFSFCMIGIIQLNNGNTIEIYDYRI